MSVRVARKSRADVPRAEGRGFTLVELLLSLTIVAASLGAIYGVFHAGLAAWNYGTAESGLSFDSVYVLDCMARDIEGAIFIEEKDGNREVEPKPAFEGGGDYVEFLTAAGRPGAPAWPNHRVRYYLDGEGGAKEGVVRLKDTPAAGAVALADEPSREAIAQRVGAFALRYLKEGEWLAEWKQTGQPCAVEVSLEITSDDGRVRRSQKMVIEVPAHAAGGSS